MRRLLWMLLAALACVSGEYLMGGHLDNNAGSKTPRKTHLDDLNQDLVAEESTVAAVAVADASAKSTVLSDDEGEGVPRYHIPYSFAFNGGKPFSLEKDPITGKIDFEKAPLVKPLNYTDGHREDNEKYDSEDRDGGKEDVDQERMKSKDHDDVGRNEITQSHYFLPTRYSSNKYQYPLISSSYANTKVQSGANSYNMYNHRLDAENDVLYARPTKNSYLSMTKTSTHKITTASDFKAKWTTPTITTSTPSTTMLFSKAPAITTWKPSSTPVHTIDRTVAEMESEKNLLPIEKLHASNQAGSQRNPSNVPTRSPNDGTTTQKTQSNLNNFVVSHARPEIKPPAQNDEYRDSYDIYDSESEEDDGDGDSNDDSKEIDYSLSFQELPKENITSTSSTTSSRPTTSTTTTTTTTTTIASSTGSTTSTTSTVVPQLPSRSSTSRVPQESVFASKPLQVSTIPQYPAASLNNDRRPSLAERHDGIINHVYRPNPVIKQEANRIGVEIPIESTSNIIISPDQNTVSFVLGNRQNVEGNYHSVGTAIGEKLYGTSPDISFWPLRNDQHGPTNEVKYEHSSAITKPSVTQKWPSPTSSALKGSNELDSMGSQNPVVPPADTAVHNTQGNKNSGYVIFSDDETKNKGAVVEEHVVIINEADGSIRELPPKTTMMMTTTMTTTAAATAAAANGTKLALPTVSENLPQLAEDLMPPAESTSQYYHYYPYETSHPEHVRPQRLPPRIKPPGSPLDPVLRKRPYLPDTKLPNILPQFRPNAKASHGHRGPDAIGTMPAGQGLPTRIRQPLSSHPASRRPIPRPAPSYLQRLNPPPPPIHAVRLPTFVPTSKMEGGVIPSHETEPTIRRFVSPARPLHGVPPVISHGNPEENVLSNRLFSHGSEERNSGGERENQKEDQINSELEHSEDSERYPEEPPMTPPRPPLFPKRRTADPPRVTTLQMLQHHGELNDENEEAPQAAKTVLEHEIERRKSDNHDPPEPMAEQPVYVVYPVNTAVNIDPDDSNEKDGSVVVGTRGPQRPLPPDTLLQDEREETHTIYNGKPSSDFPYLLERPNPSSVFPAAVKETPVLVPSEQRQQVSAAATSEREKNEDAVNVIPYLQDRFLPYRKKNEAAISVTLHRTAPTATSTSTAPTSIPTPIAYVYTPTQTAHLAHGLDYDDLRDDADAVVDAKQTVLLPSQQPSSSSSSAPAPQNFMAPFVASISAEAPSKNGWSVVVVDPPAGAEKKSDGDSDSDVNPEADTQTEKNEFDAENFKPQLFGGFKPIYEFPTEDMESSSHDVVKPTDTELNMPRHSKELPSASDKR